ncbi:hypothetical protein C8J57DRAFT_1462206 [Mycena rebaudengoi]|nr:hypothetical protein C8J57DRAFT_1462206 [Mycena rebaudengoi]
MSYDESEFLTSPKQRYLSSTGYLGPHNTRAQREFRMETTLKRQAAFSIVRFGSPWPKEPVNPQGQSLSDFQLLYYGFCSLPGTQLTISSDHSQSKTDKYLNLLLNPAAAAFAVIIIFMSCIRSRRTIAALGALLPSGTDLKHDLKPWRIFEEWKEELKDSNIVNKVMIDEVHNRILEQDNIDE